MKRLTKLLHAPAVTRRIHRHRRRSSIRSRAIAIAIRRFYVTSASRRAKSRQREDFAEGAS